MKDILNHPKHGWCNFTLPANTKDTTPYQITPSYLTDVMNDTLDACINYLKNDIGIVTYDCEGDGEWLFIICKNDCYLVSNDGENITFHSTISGDTICRNIIRCYHNHVTEWAGFAVFESEENKYNKETEKNKQKLDCKVKTIRNILSKR